jgi:hypothetical protein
MIDGKTHDPFAMQSVLPSLAPLAAHRIETVIRRCRGSYARPVDVVDAEIAEQLGITTQVTNRPRKIPAFV